MNVEPAGLAVQVKAWGRELGFQKVGIAAVELPEDERRLLDWLEAGYQGGMGYMTRHGARRARPAELVPGTLRVVSARMDYWPAGADAASVLADASTGYVSRYALGRDYHKLVRGRLARLAGRLASAVGAAGYRAFTDSAPVLEKALARNAGLGWIGKHTNLLDRQDGSWFFLGEIFTDLPLAGRRTGDRPLRQLHGVHRRLPDARDRGALPARCAALHLLPDDRAPRSHSRGVPCRDRQPHLRLRRLPAGVSVESLCEDHGRARTSSRATDSTRRRLTELFAWTETEFEERLAGSAIRRIGHERWLRNLAIALGNGPTTPEVIAALERRRAHPSEVVRDAVGWALRRAGG